VVTSLTHPANPSVGDELVKVSRRSQSERGGGSSNEFSHTTLSGVRFSALLTTPAIRAVLPSRVWSPSIHQAYPDSFRKSSKALMLCSYASYEQPLPTEKVENQVNLAATLPNVVWMEILSYTHHNWFEPPNSHGSYLQERLLEEQDSARKAHEARVEAEARCHVAQRERDVYRLLARRWQARLHSVLNRRQRATIEQDVQEMVTHLNGPISLRNSESDDDYSDDDGDNDMDVDDSGHVAGEQDNSDQEDISIEGSSEGDSFIFLSEEDCSGIPNLEESETSMAHSLSASPSSVNGIMMTRSQVRTVSISEEA
jgi:hypothetical protein